MAAQFKEIPEHQLAKWASEDLERIIRYIRKARRAEDFEAAWRASTLLVDAYKERIWWECTLVLDPSEVDEVVDGACLRLVKAMKRSPPELVNEDQLWAWMRKVVQRHCADLYRRPQEQFDRATGSIDWVYEDGNPKMEKFVKTDDGGFELVEHDDLVDQVLDQLNPEHRLVIEYRYLQDRSSKDVSEIMREQHGLEYKADNIDKIFERFRNSYQAAGGTLERP